MKMKDEKTEAEYNLSLVRLASACPIHKDDTYCPLRDMRKKSFREKMLWIDCLSLKTKQSIYQYHLICFSRDDSNHGAALL